MTSPTRCQILSLLKIDYIFFILFFYNSSRWTLFILEYEVAGRVVYESESSEVACKSDEQARSR